MAKYRVISPFLDLEDGKHVYKEGDDYPYDFQTPSKRRLNQLSTSNNKLGRPLIEKLPDEKASKNVKTKDDESYDSDEDE